MKFALVFFLLTTALTSSANAQSYLECYDQYGRFHCEQGQHPRLGANIYMPGGGGGVMPRAVAIPQGGGFMEGQRQAEEALRSEHERELMDAQRRYYETH